MTMPPLNIPPEANVTTDIRDPATKLAPTSGNSSANPRQRPRISLIAPKQANGSRSTTSRFSGTATGGNPIALPR